jgi:NTP pyrophosphatase (non-canonical NTP hydrolase)
MNDLQRLVAEFSEKTDSKLSLPYRALDLCAESGELAQAILRDAGYGKREVAKVSEKTVAELGDSIFSLLCMANEMNVDVEEVLRNTLATYEKRWQRGGQGFLERGAVDDVSG